MTTKAAEHRTKWKWEAYKPGETVAGAGVRVISEPIELGPEMRNTHYDVRYTCCNQVVRLSHERINERKRQGTTRCRPCGHKRSAEVRRLEREQAGLPVTERQLAPDEGVAQPTWKPPPYVGRCPYIDCDVGAQPEAHVDWMACFSGAFAAMLRESYGVTRIVGSDAQ